MSHEDCNFDQIAKGFCSHHKLLKTPSGSTNVQKIKEVCIALQMKIEEKEGNVRKAVYEFCRHPFFSKLLTDAWHTNGDCNSPTCPQDQELGQVICFGARVMIMHEATQTFLTLGKLQVISHTNISWQARSLSVASRMSGRQHDRTAQTSAYHIVVAQS